MLQPVDLARLEPSAYRPFGGDMTLDLLEELARRMRGVRVLHVNATPYGGGVSELLRSIVPLLRGIGLVADWHIISGDQAFFEATKAIHNALQGSAEPVTDQQWSVYREHAARNAAQMSEDYDVVIVHDPQPALLPSLRGNGNAKWVWRCHIDTADAQPAVWRELHDGLLAYDTLVFTAPTFVPVDVPPGRATIIPPAIDPLSPKNMPLPDDLARQILTFVGVDTDAPLVTQVSRFDPWKDPFGVIAAYRLARKQVPDLQLAMVASMALDDPQGGDMFREVTREIHNDSRIHLFTNLTGAGSVEVNAFQARSDVVVQKSIREGFGLVVSEAMWKGTPVVAGRTGGIELQAADGSGAILVDDVDSCAAAIMQLLDDPAGAHELGQRGQDRVRAHFLLPRLVLNELVLLHQLLYGRPADGLGLSRDPVCGIVLTSHATTATIDGERHAFCSDYCRARFAADPRAYLRLRGGNHQ